MTWAGILQSASSLATIYTIGHSTRTFEKYLEILKAHKIGLLVDIRSFPMSRRLPWFNREHLEKELPRAGIAYRWMKELGGRRRKIREDSPNTGLRVEAFRNYADYMLTEEFRRAVEELVALAGKERTCIMCAEAVYFRCHRMLVSDWLAAHGHTVLHLQDTGAARPHKPIVAAELVDGQLIYREGRPLF